MAMHVGEADGREVASGCHVGILTDQSRLLCFGGCAVCRLINRRNGVVTRVLFFGFGERCRGLGVVALNSLIPAMIKGQVVGCTGRQSAILLERASLVTASDVWQDLEPAA